MPVIDLVDVPEHYLVFALQVLWNPLSGHAGHVALGKVEDTHILPQDRKYCYFTGGHLAIVIIV